METFSIVEKINVNKLNEKIAEFVYKEGHEPYIFANKETLDILTKPIEQELHFGSLQNGTRIYIGQNCLIGRYRGNKMFRDDTLGFGEIELR